MNSELLTRAISDYLKAGGAEDFTIICTPKTRDKIMASDLFSITQEDSIPEGRIYIMQQDIPSPPGQITCVARDIGE